MTSFAKFSLAFVFGGVTAVTPASTQTDKTQTIIVPAASSANCPVAMRAERSPGLTARVPVGKNGSVIAKPQTETGQELQLTLTNSEQMAISVVRIVFHGWDGKGRTLPTNKASDAELSRTLDLAVSLAPHATREMDVWVNGLPWVDAIDLAGVSYADGSSWESPESQACHIVPDLKMLISLR